MKHSRHFITSALLLALTLSGQAWAVEFGITRPATLGSQQQSYFERPDILTVQAHPHPELNWNSWRQAHLEAAAAFLELYPTEHLYFLARDAELLYDAVRLISRDDPQTLARLHLLNVSRANMRDEHLLEYLAQEGITPERLRSDPTFQPIFIDTGFSGTIPRVIAERMPENVRARLKTHLLVSSNERMPSLRVFLFPVNPAINGQSPSSMHGTIAWYEHMPRATDRSDAYQLLDGEWHPVSNAGAHSDGQVNAAKAHRYQEDLKAYLKTPDSLSALQSRRGLWRELRQQWLSLSKEQWIEFLKTTLSDLTRDRAQIEPIVRDFLEWAELIGKALVPNALIVHPLRVDLALEAGARLSNKDKLIALHPQWTQFLENPDTEIPALLDAGQVSTLGAILDVIRDDEIRLLALDNIATRLDQHLVYALAEALLEKNATLATSQAEHTSWTFALFKHSNTSAYPALLKHAIQIAHPQNMSDLIPGAFSHSHWSYQPELLRLAIEKTPASHMLSLASVFHNPEWANHPELLQLAIENATGETMQFFARDVFSQPHWANQPDLLRLAIQKSTPSGISSFARYVFSQKYWSSHPELLRLVIDKAYPPEMYHFADYVVNQSHWADEPELLRLVFEKTPVAQIRYFARQVFSQPHWSNQPALLRAAIERTPEDQLPHYSQHTFNQPHWTTHPLIEVFRAATQISDPEQRRAFFRERMGPYPWESAEQPSLCEQQMLENAS